MPRREGLWILLIRGGLVVTPILALALLVQLLVVHVVLEVSAEIIGAQLKNILEDCLDLFEGWLNQNLVQALY